MAAAGPRQGDQITTDAGGRQPMYPKDNSVRHPGQISNVPGTLVRSIFFEQNLQHIEIEDSLNFHKNRFCCVGRNVFLRACV